MLPDEFLPPLREQPQAFLTRGGVQAVRRAPDPGERAADSPDEGAGCCSTGWRPLGPRPRWNAVSRTRVPVQVRRTGPAFCGFWRRRCTWTGRLDGTPCASPRRAACARDHRLERHSPAIISVSRLRARPSASLMQRRSYDFAGDPDPALLAVLLASAD